MNIRYRSAIGPLLLLLLIALLPAATPAGRAADTVDQTGPTFEVSGTVQLPPGSAPAVSALVWLQRLTAEGQDDPTGIYGAYTDIYGQFSFNVSPGTYRLEIVPPDNEPTARELRDFSVVVDGTGPVALGAITLPLAVKRITGSVQLGGAGLSGVYVYAYTFAGLSRSTRTANDGSFGLGLEPGEWLVYAGNSPGALWQFVDPRSSVVFTDDGALDERALSLTMQPTTGTIQGRVLTPDGQPLTLPPIGTSYNPYVYAIGDSFDVGRYEYLDATGAFTMPVVADSYTLYVYFDEQYYQFYGSPPSLRAQAGAGVTDVGTLTLELRDSAIEGVVRDSAGAPVGYVPVEASREGGFVETAYTAADGSYRFKLAAATWEVSVLPDPSSGFLDEGSYQQVTTSRGVTTTLDFTLARGANTVQGSFIDADSPATPLTDVRGWAYARDASGEYVAWDYVESGGFVLNVPAGSLRVGVLLAPGSRYSLAEEAELPAQQALAGDAAELAPYEQELTVAPALAGSPAAALSVSVPLRANNATISGRVLDQAGNPVTGVPVVVGLTPARAADAWQWADVDPGTGGFSIPVSAGVWYLSAFVDDETSPYHAPFSEPIAVTVGPGATTTQDIALQKLDGVVRGTVRDDAGTPLAGELVWVSSPFFTASAETDGGGAYEILVPLLNPDGSAASYQLGGDFTCASPESCFFDSDPVSVVPAARLVAGEPTLAQAVSGNIVAVRATDGAILKGRLVNNGIAYGGKYVKPGAIDDVTIKEDKTDNNGVFEVLLTFRGRGPDEYDGHLKVGSKTIRINGIDRPNLLAGLAQTWPTVELLEFSVDPTEGLPRGLSAVFDNASGWSATLSDGTRVEIAPGSVPLAGDDGTQVRVSVTPTINIYPTAQFAEANWYGYDIVLTAVSSNRQITGELLAPARLVLRYGGLDYALNNIRESQLRPARLADERWTAADAFVLDRGANKVTVQTKTLGTWALVQERGPCAGCVYLPIVR
jgi:hypothetical protein